MEAGNTIHLMRSARVITTTWSGFSAEQIASQLRLRGFESYVKTNFDSSAYGNGLGGASVFVDADQLVEAELELILIQDELAEVEKRSHQDHSVTGENIGEADDEPEIQPRQHKSAIKIAAVVALAAMVTAFIVPSALVIWTTFFG